MVAAVDDNELLHLVSAPERSRARARLRRLATAHDEDPPEAVRLLSQLLRNRAARRCYMGAGPDLVDIRHDPRVQLYGLSHAESGLAAGDIVEGYVSAEHVEDLRQHYLLREVDIDRANVVCHVVSADIAQILPRLGDARQLLLAADLAEHDGPRERHRAEEVLSVLILTLRSRQGAGRPKRAGSE